MDQPLRDQTIRDQTIRRVRHEPKKRHLTVRETLQLTPGMLRLVLQGADLDGFHSASPDDHIKLFVPGTAAEPERRDYTPRHYDQASQTLAIDFALHDAGPATSWARHAKPGDPAEIGGPRGSAVVPWAFDWFLLIGDETALPAIGRRIEEAPAGTRFLTLVAIAGPEDQQVFDTQAHHEAHWVFRPADQAHDPAPLMDALEQLPFPPGEGFVWAAAEAQVARAIKNHVLGPRAHNPAWTKIAGYWQKGQADANVKLD